MSNHQLPVFNGTDQQCGNAHKAQGYDAQYPNNPNYMLGYNNPGSELDRLRAINAELLAALEQAYRLIIRFEAHKGNMDAEQLAKAENEARTISSFGHGRWAGDTVYCDMDKIRAAIAKAQT